MFRLLRPCSAGVLGLLLLLCGVPLQAQNRGNRGNDENPRVERLVFRGVDALEVGELRAAIMHQPTRCRSILMRPFCWVFPNSPLFVDRHYLIPEELPRDELRLRIFAFRRGYREAEVASEVRPRGRGVEAVFTLEEGPPTLIDTVIVQQADEVLRERHLRRAGLPRAGQPLNLVQLDTSLANVNTDLEERGYLDAAIEDSIEVLDRRARVEILIEPGRRATLAELDIRGNEQIEDRVIRDALRLREDRVLRRSDLVAAQRSLYESNLFHEARVELPEQPDSAKRVEIRVREAPPRSARIGGGFNTAEFVQTEGRLVHYNFFGGGRRLDVRATVGNLLAPQLNATGIFRDVIPDGFAGEATAYLQPTWLASLDFMQPAFRTADNALGLGLFAHRRSVPGIVIDRGFGGDVSFTRRLDHQTPASLSYRHEITAVEAGHLYFCVNYGICDLPTIGALSERHGLSPLTLSVTTERTDDPLAPTTGISARLDLEHASGLTLSDYHYHRISGRVSYHLPFGIRHRRVLAGRLRAGWVHPLESTADAIGIGNEIEAILHPRKRFYSGGARSVRGYGENQLGPRILTIAPAALLPPEDGNANGADDATGPEYCTPQEIAAGTCDPNLPGIAVDAFVPRPLGGTSVLEGNVEYRFPVWQELRGAVFVDAAIVRGQGTGLLGEGRAAVTPGFGIRYRTVVGPIRADLGIRPTLVETLPVFTEVQEHGERRLVQLNTPRRYDPLADTGAWYWQVLSRLQLHLSIGEPF